MDFESLLEFNRDLKFLLKKYRTLADDLEMLKTILKSRPNQQPPFSFTIDNLGLSTCIVKIKKMACKSLKGRGVNSGLRLIYAYFPDEKKIVFIELSHKNDKESEDRQRILDNFK